MIKNIYFKHIPLLDAVSTKSLIVDSYICSWFCTSQCENLAEEKQQEHVVWKAFLNWEFYNVFRDVRESG